MKLNIKLLVLMLSFGFVMLSHFSYSQEHRKLIRKGNEEYKGEKYDMAEVEYMRALDQDSLSQPAIFNLGDALYKQGKYDDALKRYARILELLKSPPAVDEDKPRKEDELAKAEDTHYNIGNVHFMKSEWDEAIEAYKNSLRLNPADTTAKFNLAYAQLKKQEQEQQEQENQDNQDNQDQDNQDKQDQNQDNQNQDNQDDNQDKQDQDNQDQDQQDKQDQNQDQQDKQDQQSEPKISQEQAEKMLQAIQANEDKTQEKVKDKKAGAVVVSKSGKNW